MPPGERERHDAWKRSHSAGPPEARAGKKLIAAYETSNVDPQDFTIAELEAMIADLKAARDAPKPNEGVFE